ncbi:threonine/serine exporter family protein [Virgibacillus sp. NKC19-3]|uniref:threonine/serine exporter family protein n=1 Tax=Virgibacillus saliphilus TaxID=2831674 RepID=UPI001C9AF6B9|nr:threonine/serine exporter family protein [Virgibacillus sp. NKC19-3]MBY7144691.1 threonine/serine exporter family protein [Virgibacillus sp. NKC19-3]
MDIIIELITSFIAAAGFGILFNAPRQVLIPCGLVGMSGWILYDALTELAMDAVPATIFAAMLVAVLSQLCAKFYKKPIIVFSVSGIIPLVPGGIAYDAMRHFVENDYYHAVQLSAQVMLLAGGIAMGLVFSEVVNQVARKFSRQH